MQRLRIVLVSLLAVSGCKAISDSQYDDRADELEVDRVEFLRETDQVKFFAAADSKIYWVSLEKPLDEPVLHSLDPKTGGQPISYEFTRADTNIEERYHMSDQLVMKCNFSTATAFDAKVSNRMIDMSTMNVDENCAVAGDVVYFFTGNRTITRWMPGGPPPSVAVDLAVAGVGTGSFGGFNVLGTRILFSEGGRLWLIETTTGVATWLENVNPATNLVVFDERGVLYGSSKGDEYILFADHSTFLLDAAIADGGYHMNSSHGDIQELDDTAEYVLFNHHVIYRGKSGIFAFNLETKKVTDLLLDRGTGFDAETLYSKPTITTGGTLFVQASKEFSSSTKPIVYSLDLTARLK